MIRYEIRIIFEERGRVFDWLDRVFSNKKGALWYLRRLNGLAEFRLIRVKDHKQIAHKNGYDRVIMDI